MRTRFTASHQFVERARGGAAVALRSILGGVVLVVVPRVFAGVIGGSSKCLKCCFLAPGHLSHSTINDKAF